MWVCRHKNRLRLRIHWFRTERDALIFFPFIRIICQPPSIFQWVFYSNWMCASNVLLTFCFMTTRLLGAMKWATAAAADVCVNIIQLNVKWQASRGCVSKIECVYLPILLLLVFHFDIDSNAHLIDAFHFILRKVYCNFKAIVNICLQLDIIERQRCSMERTKLKTHTGWRVRWKKMFTNRSMWNNSISD